MNTTSKPQRHYVPEDAHKRMVQFAGKNDIRLQEAYEIIILAVLDAGGNMKAKLILTESQQQIIQDIAHDMNQSPEKTVQDLIYSALLIYGTEATLRDVLTSAAPVMMDSIAKNKPGMAREILKGLKAQK